jgi:hypothetical protein
MTSATAAAPSVGQLLIAAFGVARSLSPDVAQRWITVSYRIGGKIPGSLAIVSAQRIGELDLVCRALEDELLRSPSNNDEMDFRHNYLLTFSQLWIGSAYAACFALKDRRLLLDNAEFLSLAEDLRLVRVQLEKHQIASDRSLEDPLPLSTGPAQPGDGPERIVIYDKSDRQRAHVGRMGVSDRMSPMWEIIVAKPLGMRWMERRELADRMLAVFERTTLEGPRPANSQ